MPEYIDRKVEYTVFDVPENIESTQWMWCYSATEFEKELNERFLESKMKGIYVELEGYLESLYHDIDYINLSFEGGGCKVVFEDSILELGIHAEGQFIYRIIPLKTVNIYEKKENSLKDDHVLGKCYLNIDRHNLSVKTGNQIVSEISVIGTDMWSFNMESFDMVLAQKAAKKTDLPAEIKIVTENSIIHIIGDDMEYYSIKVEKQG